MKKAILAALLSASTTAGAVAMCVNSTSPDGAEIGLCRTDSLALCPQGTTNTYTGNLGSAAACDAVLDPYLSQRQRDIRAAQARTDAWFTEAQQMCQALAGQCVADRVAYMQAQWDAAQAAAAKAIADAAAAAAAAQAQAAANTVMTTNTSPIQIAQPTTTTPAPSSLVQAQRTPMPPTTYPSAGSGLGSGSTADQGTDGRGVAIGGEWWKTGSKSSATSSGPYHSASEWDAINKAKAAERIEIAQAEPVPKRNCDEFFETRASVEYWGSRDQKGNINNVCRKPVRK